MMEIFIKELIWTSENSDSFPTSSLVKKVCSVGRVRHWKNCMTLCDNDEKESQVKQLLVDFTEMNTFAKQSYSELSQLYRQSILN